MCARRRSSGRYRSGFGPGSYGGTDEVQGEGERGGSPGDNAGEFLYEGERLRVMVFKLSVGPHS